MVAETEVGERGCTGCWSDPWVCPEDAVNQWRGVRVQALLFVSLFHLFPHFVHILK